MRKDSAPCHCPAQRIWWAPHQWVVVRRWSDKSCNHNLCKMFERSVGKFVSMHRFIFWFETHVYYCIGPIGPTLALIWSDSFLDNYLFIHLGLASRDRFATGLSCSWVYEICYAWSWRGENRWLETRGGARKKITHCKGVACILN